MSGHRVRTSAPPDDELGHDPEQSPIESSSKFPDGLTAPSGPRKAEEPLRGWAHGRGGHEVTAANIGVLAVMAYCLCICAVVVASLFTEHRWQNWTCGLAAALSFCCGLHWSIQLAIIHLSDGIRRKR